MALIPESFIDEVVSRSDIESVVGEYVQLTKSSGSNKFGLCPFHNEKTPSFSVNTSKQIYYCFGCHKGGGVINFIMEADNVSYVEAVEKLALRAGLQMPEGPEDETGKHKKRILELNCDAAHFYVSMLGQPGGSRAVEYLRKRQLSPETVRNFGLGAAPAENNALYKAMKAKGYSDKELFDADLIRKGQYGYYDTFRDRLMFPIIDQSQQDKRRRVLGFSGRALSDDAKAKYLNSRDTLVYNKRKRIFGLNLAKVSKLPCFILTEGNIDVCMLHQAGFDSAVASLGTAFTEEQAKLLSNYGKDIIIAYDSDTAGQSAANKAINLFSKLGVKTRVLKMKDAKDPDEYIKKFGADAFRMLIDGSENPLDFNLNKLIAQYPDLSAAGARAEFLKEATRLAARIANPLEREVFCGKIAETGGVGKDTVLKEAERIRKYLINKSKKADNLNASGLDKSVQPADRRFTYGNPASAVAEEGIIRMIYLYPELINDPELPPPEDFSSDVLKKIYTAGTELLKRGAELTPNTIGKVIEPEEVSLFTSITVKPESSGTAAFGDYISRLRSIRQEAAVTDLRAIMEAERKKKAYITEGE